MIQVGACNLECWRVGILFTSKLKEKEEGVGGCGGNMKGGGEEGGVLPPSPSLRF